MALGRQERMLYNRKAKAPTFMDNIPNDSEGENFDITYRRIKNVGIVQYVKINNHWESVFSSTATSSIPERTVRSVSSAGTFSSIADHNSLSNLSDDGHTQYLLVDGTRAMTGDLSLGGGDGALTFTDSGENSIKIPDNMNRGLVIEEANNAYMSFDTRNGQESVNLGVSLDASDNAINLTTGNIVFTPSANDTVTLSAGSGGTFNITTVDNDATAGHINFTADGTFDIVSAGLFKVDSNNGITLDANSGVISFLDNATNGLTFTNSSGDWEIDNATANKNIDLHIDSASMLKLDGTTNGVHINNYSQTLYSNYKLHVKGNNYFYTQGEADYKQNYSMVSEEDESKSANFASVSVTGWNT
mgnify:CR=1 FL=1